MSPAEYDFWLFDLDGTLVDAEWSYARATLDRVGERLGRPFTDREARALWYGFGAARNDRLRGWGIDPAAFWATFDDVEDPQARAAATYLHDDAAAFLRAIGADTPVGVVTHCQPFVVDPVLDRLGVRDWFDTVVCCSADLGWKPDPTPVERAMDRLGVAGDDAGALAGDGANDVGAAWNAGLDAVHVERHGHERRGLCVRGDRRVRSLEELLAVSTSD